MAKTPAKVEKKTEVATMGGIELDDLVHDSEVGHGFTRDDLALPFIRVLQKLSPQLDRSEPEFIKGAEEGDFLNTATQEIVGTGSAGIYFVPAVYTINYTEWKPRESGGGIVHDYGTDDSCLKNTTREKGRDVNRQGNYIVTSALYYGHLLDKETGTWEQAILACASTQLKKSRKLNAVIQNFRMTVELPGGEKRVISPRMWFHVFHITTLPESNEHGKWMGLKIERDCGVNDLEYGGPLYAEGQMLDKLFQEGKVRAQAEHLGGDEGTVTSDAGSSSKGADDDDIPF